MDFYLDFPSKIKGQVVENNMKSRKSLPVIPKSTPVRKIAKIQ